MSPITADFNISNEKGNPQLALPISLFLVGYIFGPLLFGPLSELYGRKYVIQAAFAGYTAFTLGCALAPSWAVLLFFRFAAGVFASAPLAVGGGVIADMYNDPSLRGRFLTYFLTINICAPVIAPTISGYISQITWRWVFWVGLIIAGATWIPLILLPETFGPIILLNKAKYARKMARKSGSDSAQIYAAIELENKGWQALARVVLVRPLTMLFMEPIVTASSLYVAIAYAVFFMFFQTYPLIFKGVHGMSAQTMGLVYLPIAGGTLIGLVVFLVWDSYWKSSLQAGRPWAKKKEYSRLPLACIAGPLFVVSLFWLGWTARSSISWVVPCLAGIPFGTANLLITIALTNYLGDSYGVFSASAMAASASFRSLIGSGLPLAAAPMYKELGIAWATSILGFISVFMCAIPFIFIYYGDVIRERSRFYQQLLQAEQAKMELEKLSV
jgi:MFS family permease